MWHSLHPSALALAVVTTAATLGGLRTLADSAYQDSAAPFLTAYQLPATSIEVVGRRIQHIEVVGRSKAVQRIQVIGRRSA